MLQMLFVLFLAAVVCLVANNIANVLICVCRPLVYEIKMTLQQIHVYVESFRERGNG